MSTTPSSTPTPDPEDAWLEKLLRHPAANQPTAPGRDPAAFAERVMAALPPPADAARRTSRRRRKLLIFCAAVLGCAVTWFCGGAALFDSMRETTQLAQAASARLQASETAVVHILAAISAVAMLWFFGRRDLRRLFQ